MNWFRKNKWQVWLLAGLVVTSYINVWGAEFVADDVYGIVNNETLGEFARVFENPLVWPRNLYYFLVVNVFGKVPWVFRFLNVLSHLLMSIGVYLLVSLMANKRVAMVAGSLTAVHPIMVESVTWISGGGHSNYALMLVISMILYIRSKENAKYLWWSLASFLMALFISEKAASFPGILLAYEFLIGDLKKKWKRLVPFFLISGLWVVMYATQVSVRRDLLTTNFNSQGSENGVNLWQQIIIAITSYLGLILWPNKLTLYHSEMSFSVFSYWVKVAAVLSYLGVMVWGFCKGKKQLVFWLLWFLVGLSVTLMPLGVAWVVAERYVYFSAVGVYVLVGFFIDRLMKRTKWTDELMIAFGILVSLLMIRTLIRNSNWQTADKLWLSAARTSPSSPQNNNNLGDYYGRMGNIELSNWHYLRAIKVNSNYADAMHNLANNYARTGRFDEAIKYYERALENKPQLWQSREQLELLRKYLESL